MSKSAVELINEIKSVLPTGKQTLTNSEFTQKTNQIKGLVNDFVKSNPGADEIKILTGYVKERMQFQDGLPRIQEKGSKIEASAAYVQSQLATLRKELSDTAKPSVGNLLQARFKAILNKSDGDTPKPTVPGKSSGG